VVFLRTHRIFTSKDFDIFTGMLEHLFVLFEKLFCIIVEILDLFIEAQIMKTHQMKLAKEPFEKIINDEKIIESRLFDEKRKQINVGDRIEFSQNDDLKNSIITKVVALYLCHSFEELFSKFPASDFGGGSKEGLLQEIHQFYSIEDENKFGVIGIKIEKK